MSERVLLKKVEVAAMWLFHREYSRQALGIVEFCKQLSQYDKNNVRRMVKEIVEATP